MILWSAWSVYEIKYDASNGKKFPILEVLKDGKQQKLEVLESFIGNNITFGPLHDGRIVDSAMYQGRFIKEEEQFFFIPDQD